MKIVLDTNVLISGVFWGGKPRKILSLWAEGKFKMVATGKIFDEYIRVMKKIDKNERMVNKWSAFILENSVFVDDKRLVNICRDPEDNKFLDCALFAKARYIISGDDDLVSLKKTGKTKIVTPGEYLEILERM